MMEKVRAAVFNMLLSRCGDMLRLPEQAAWLDLFAGDTSSLMLDLIVQLQLYLMNVYEQENRMLQKKIVHDCNFVGSCLPCRVQKHCFAVELCQQSSSAYSGTGSVGLEALSRGVKLAHFIELDPWVVRKILTPNLEHCEVVSQSSVYTMKAEDYLQRALAAPEYATKFDFIRWANHLEYLPGWVLVHARHREEIGSGRM